MLAQYHYGPFFGLFGVIVDRVGSKPDEGAGGAGNIFESAVPFLVGVSSGEYELAPAVVNGEGVVFYGCKIATGAIKVI